MQKLTISMISSIIFKDCYVANPEDCYLALIYIIWSSYTMYSSPCILRPPLQPLNFGLKLKVVLNWRDICIENIRIVSLIAGLKIEGIVKWRGLKSQGPL